MATRRSCSASAEPPGPRPWPRSTAMRRLRGLAVMTPCLCQNRADCDRQGLDALVAGHMGRFPDRPQVFERRFDTLNGQFEHAAAGKFEPDPAGGLRIGRKADGEERQDRVRVVLKNVMRTYAQDARELQARTPAMVAALKAVSGLVPGEAVGDDYELIGAPQIF